MPWDNRAGETVRAFVQASQREFRSVVGTMWAMANIDGRVLARSFYESLFSDGARGVRYFERTAAALRGAVGELRRKGGMTLER